MKQNLNLFFLLFTLFFGAIFNKVCAEIQANTEIDISLNSYNLRNHNYEFKGDALFFWKQFLNLSEIEVSKEAVEISIENSWNNQPDDMPDYSKMGFGTYFLKITIPQDLVGKKFILRPSHFISYASEVYVNEELVANGGSVGESKNDPKYKPKRSIRASTFIADTTVLNIVIWVSNFNHFRGGVFAPIKFGLEKNMQNEREREITLDLLVIVSLLIMFFYHVLIYFVNKREIASLYFALACLVFSVDLSMQGPMCFFLFFPNASFAVSSMLHLCVPYLIPTSFLFFIYALFPDVVSKRIRNFSGIFSVLLISVTLFNIAELNSLITKPFYIYALLIVFYFYLVAYILLKKRVYGATLFTVAYAVFSVCVVNDLLNMFEVIHTTNLLSYGLLVFVFMLSVLQGKRTDQLYLQSVKLTSELKDLNKTLEEKVKERTSQLEISYSKLRKLSDFKQDMTNLIVHDLKGPLSVVVNMKAILQENYDLGVNLILAQGHKMLNLVQNILDVHKYEKAEMVLKKEELNLVVVIMEVLSHYEYQIKQKSIKCIVPEHIDCVLYADKDLLKRVYSNLISNALKFSPEFSQIRFVISENNGVARCSVFNKGEHIHLEKCALIFDRYQQVEEIADGGIRSTGLGLTFCKLAIEAHEGTIGVDSKENEEIEFWFSIPGVKHFDKGIQKDKIDKETETLSINDKIYLTEFAIKLNGRKVYEVSQIMTILQQIDKKNVLIEEWIATIEKSIYLICEKEYYRNIQIVLAEDV